ncbi:MULTISPECIES: hypothetical protein [Chelativorans]|nr:MULTISPECIES: hypothetical protein [Chelativorans]
MAGKRKITTGANDRPVDESIAQTGEGLPDDSGHALSTDEAQVARARESLKPEKLTSGQQAGNPDAVPEGTPGAGENICRRCRGSGEIGGSPCPDCGGSGKVITPIGGA